MDMLCFGYMTINVKLYTHHWKRESERSFDIAQLLFSKNKFPEALFFGQLTLEKILKGLVVQVTRDSAVPVHDLHYLAKKAKLKLSKQQEQELKEITTFHIAGRYENIKQSFRRKCTKPYSKQYFELITKYYQWLKNELSQQQSGRT